MVKPGFEPWALSPQPLPNVQDAEGSGVGSPFPWQGKDTDSSVPPNPVPDATPSSLPNPFPLCALLFSSQVYEGGSNVDQFVTRFLLKETANQIQSLLSSVESAVEAIEQQTSQIRCVWRTL